MPVSSQQVPEILVKRLGVLSGQSSCLHLQMQCLQVVGFAVLHRRQEFWPVYHRQLFGLSHCKSLLEQGCDGWRFFIILKLKMISYAQLESASSSRIALSFETKD